MLRQSSSGEASMAEGKAEQITTELEVSVGMLEHKGRLYSASLTFYEEEADEDSEIGMTQLGADLRFICLDDVDPIAGLSSEEEETPEVGAWGGEISDTIFGDCRPPLMKEQYQQIIRTVFQYSRTDLVIILSELMRSAETGGKDTAAEREDDCC